MPEAPAPDQRTGRPEPEVVETGHIGLGHRSRRGDAVRAWYRGACVPFPTMRDAAKDGTFPIAHSADQLRRVVPDGREDLSYAAAFEIGRLLALSQLSIVSAMMRFRGEQFGAARIRQLLADITALQIPAVLNAGATMSHFVALQMIDNIVQNPARIIGPRRPVADPGRELTVRGDLDEIIATGLGLDLAAVRKASDQLGILTALTRTQAPIANPRGRIEIDQQVLRSTLNAELNRTLNVAAPQKVVPVPRVQRGAKQIIEAEAKPDALDELIANATEPLTGEEEDI
ncbi:MAG: hypothetical protein U0Y68_19045 [Blastocatellia bacterium]